MTPHEFEELLKVHCHVNARMRSWGVAKLLWRGLIEPALHAPYRELLASVGPYGVLPLPASNFDWSCEHFNVTPKGKALIKAMAELPLPQAELHSTTETVYVGTRHGLKRVSQSTEAETVWVIPGTDFEFAEAEL